MAEKHILCISGGKDSMATAILALEHGEPLDMAVYCEVMFDRRLQRWVNMRAIFETIPRFEDYKG